jgi:hypothetical protein
MTMCAGWGSASSTVLKRRDSEDAGCLAEVGAFHPDSGVPTAIKRTRNNAFGVMCALLHRRRIKPSWGGWPLSGLTCSGATAEYSCSGDGRGGWRARA